MKIGIAPVVALAAATLSIPAVLPWGGNSAAKAFAPPPPQSTANLHAALKNARNDLRELRKLAGLHAHATGPHIDPEGHHEGESPEAQRRERDERAGHEDGGREGGERGHGREGGERGHGREGGERGHGREGGQSQAEGKERISKLSLHKRVYRNGAELTLQFNPATSAFIGSVKNISSRTLPQVRVEIHLSNGVELGPTMRVDLKPGESVPVELSALDQDFRYWVTHPETGVEEGHGEGEEESSGHAGERGGEHRGEGREGRGEHRGEGREGGENTDASANLKPAFNQIQLLRGEMRAFAKDLKAKAKK